MGGGAAKGDGGVMLFKLCRVASISTVVLALIDISLNLTMICAHWCAMKVDFPASSSKLGLFGYFYANYLGGEECSYDNLPNSTVTPIWYDCQLSTPILLTNSPRKETDPEATFIWVTVLLVLDCLWLVFGITLEIGRSPTRAKKPIYLPWAITTALILVYGMTAAIVYFVDLQYPMDMDDCMLTADLKDAQDNLLLSVLVLPFFFFRGFIVWFAILFLLIKVIVEGSRFTPPQPNLYATPNKAQLGRSLSQFGDDEGKIIKNPQAQSIADQTDATSVVPISALPPILTAEERRLSDYMVYANEGYEPSPTTGNDQFSFGPAVVAGAAAGAAAASVQRTPSNQSNQHRSLYRNPSGSQYRPPMGNDGLSEISEAPVVPPRQRLGDDIAAPTFDIPRARVADREPRRVIRSPSGRQVAAHDYLMDEYRAKQGLGQLPTSSGKQNSRRKDSVERYYVPLKD